jgi:hypothetical protein
VLLSRGHGHPRLRRITEQEFADGDSGFVLCRVVETSRPHRHIDRPLPFLAGFA